MTGGYGKAVITGAGYGLLFAVFAFGISPMVPVASIGVGGLYAGSILLGIFFSMGVEALAGWGGPALIEQSRRNLIGFWTTVALSVIVGYSWKETAGPTGLVLPGLFLIPLFLILWRDRWSPEVGRKGLAELGTEDQLWKLMAWGAGAGILAGLRTGPWGVLFAALFGAVVGAFVWMDANERRRRLPG
jgi:hypothetical protein